MGFRTGYCELRRVSFRQCFVSNPLSLGLFSLQLCLPQKVEVRKELKFTPYISIGYAQTFKQFYFGIG
jgi:hypothetical protein